MYRFGIVILCLVLIGCGSSETKTNKIPLIVCTTGMIADMARQVVGDQAEVVALMGTGVDPHLYKPTQGDLGKLQKADAIFYNGLHLEGKMTEIFEKLEHKKNVVAVSHGIDQDQLISISEKSDQKDPHIWFDVNLWSKSIPNIQSGVAKIPAIDATKTEHNAILLVASLQELHQYVLQEIASIPKEQRVLATSHDAFQYFGKAYDIDVIALQGVSTLSEFGLKDVDNMMDYVMENKVKAVFVESSVPQKPLQAVVEGCQAKNFPIEIGGTLFSDAMGESGTPEGTYIGMVKYNVNTIVAALK